MKLKTLAVACLVLVTGLSAHANTRNVGNVMWHKSTTGTIDEFRSLTYSDRAGGMVFIRPASNNQKAKESSTNIGIDGRFLVSVQDGHYTSSAVCAGTVQLSSVPTGVHINDLAANPLLVSVRPREVQYFVVHIGDNFQPHLEQVNSATAGELLQNTYRQGHQISRVDVNNCPEPISLQPTIAQPPVFTPPPPPVAQVPTLRLNIQFDHDKSNIKPEFKGEVDKAAEFLAQYSGMDAIIEGHTDSNGTDAYNVGLSQRRANTVRQALISQYGINPSRLTAIGYGESRPIATNATEEGRYTNRRVMVVIPQANR